MNPSKIATIAWHEYITNVRRIGFIFVTLLFPALGMLGIVIAGFFSGQASNFLKSQFVPPSKQLGVVDYARLFRPLAPSFDQSFVAYPDEASAKSALLADTVAAYAVIPNDYMLTGKVTMYTKSILGVSSSTDTADLRVLLVKGLLSGKVDEATLTRVAVPVRIDYVTLDSQGKTQVGGALSIVAGFVAPYIFSILLLVSVFASSGYLLRSVSEEKETRVIEIVLSSVSPTELMAGKVIGLGLLGLTQVGFWLGSSLAFSGGLGALFAGAVIVLNPGSFILAALYFVLGYLLFGTIMATAGSLGTNVRESQQLAGLFTFWAALPTFFASIVFTNPNAMLVRVLSLFPLTAPTMMMLRLPMTEVPIVDIVGSIGVLVISILVVLWASGKIFRIGLLMYGKRPALKEIWAALRKA